MINCIILKKYCNILFILFYFFPNNVAIHFTFVEINEIIWWYFGIKYLDYLPPPPPSQQYFLFHLCLQIFASWWFFWGKKLQSNENLRENFEGGHSFKCKYMCVSINIRCYILVLGKRCNLITSKMWYYLFKYIFIINIFWFKYVSI